MDEGEEKLVQLPIRHQETTADSQDCREEYLCPPANLQDIYISGVRKRAKKKIIIIICELHTFLNH